MNPPVTPTLKRLATRPAPVHWPGWLVRVGAATGENVEFVWSFLRAPGRVGAVLPSSPSLARRMIAGHELARARTVVELGPGSGAFTRVIREHLGSQTTFFALELDGQAVGRLRERFPDLLVYHDSAEQVQNYLSRHGRPWADSVISGLPWANMDHEVQRRIMVRVVRALAPDGVFTTFTYFMSPLRRNGRSYRRILGELFHAVEVSRIVWRNFPPAIVYRCTHAHPAEATARAAAC